MDYLVEIEVPETTGFNEIYVKDYADANFGCVLVARHLLCHYRPRELPWRGTKGPGIP